MPGLLFREAECDVTLMLASVANAEEAALAAAGGADIVDFEEPARGVVAAAAPEIVEAGVRAVAERAATCASLGNPPYDAASLIASATDLRKAGVDMLRLAVDGPTVDAFAQPLAALARGGRLIGVLFADEAPDFGLIARLAALGFRGAMLATRAKGAGRLIAHLDVARLAAFVAQAQAVDLMAALAGTLEPPDVPRLLLTGADALGFRGALLNPQTFALVRDLIPRERPKSDAGARGDQRQLGSGQDRTAAPDADLDRIFVRDFVMQAQIGAYAFERGGRQRVAFDLDAWVARAADPGDLRSIFSYDVILDAIRLIVAQGHHEFVEGLAEAVAARVLAHPRVRAVRIVVRKLDVIPGAVGVEIVRRRANAAPGFRLDMAEIAVDAGLANPH